MKTITPQAARLENYTEITVPINPRTEPQIFASMEASLAGADAVWLDHGDGTFSAARRTSELVLDPPRQKRDILPLEALVDADERRERKTGRADA